MMLMQTLLFAISAANLVLCTIDGLSFMDAIEQRDLDKDKKYPRGEDPCNPLYWYPRHIPESCLSKNTPMAPKQGPSTPLPVPIPIPIEPMPYPEPLPFPYPDLIPMPMPPPMPMPQPMHMSPPMLMQPSMPMPPPIPMPTPMSMSLPMPMPGPLLPIPASMPLPAIPYGIPIRPSGPMLPVLGNLLPGYRMSPHPYPPFQFYRSGQQIGFVPNVPGLVSPDGGINILPFSDAYSELLEKHKQKMIRKEMEKIIKKYNNKYKSYRRHGRRPLYD